MKNSLASLVIFLLLAGTGAAQDGFAYKRQVKGSAKNWAKIVLPDDIYAKLAPGFGDLRLIGTNSSGERVEVPYVLRQLPERKDVRQAFELLNQTSAGETRFFTFETLGYGPINRIDLDFGKPNFDRKVKLEGSDDRKNWQTIIDDYRIVSIKNDATEYSFTRLLFPNAKFKFFRLSFDSKDDPGKLSASLRRIETDPSAVRSFAVTSFKVETEKNTKSTILDVRLKYPVPVSSLVIKIDDEVDFYRPFTVSYRVGTDNEGRDLYRGAVDGTVSSFESSAFEFPEVVADRLQINVRDGDSPALTFREPVVLGRPYEMLFRYPEDGEYFLYYSNPHASKPEYDLAQFTQRAPSDLPALPLGNEVATGLAVTNGALQSKWWLWPLMVLAVLLMLWFAFKLLNKSK
jgi:hypothetical protein